MGSRGRRQTRKFLMDRDGNHCFYCETFLQWDLPQKLAEIHRDRAGTIDHVIPKSRGGSGNYDNLVLACRHCNETKGDMTGEEFLRATFENPVPKPKREFVGLTRFTMRYGSMVHNWQGGHHEREVHTRVDCLPGGGQGHVQDGPRDHHAEPSAQLVG